jgi:hypothetical protein
LAIKNSADTVSDALWISILAGLEAVLIEVIILGSFSLFDPTAKRIMENHSLYFLISSLVIFVAGFGVSLQFALEMQFWRGKWK